MFGLHRWTLLWLLSAQQKLLGTILAFRWPLDRVCRFGDVASILDPRYPKRDSSMKRNAEVSESGLKGPKKQAQAATDSNDETTQRQQLESSDNVQYYFQNGFRLVLPYDHVYESFTKGRWMGRTLYDVISSEFAAFTDDYVKCACANGTMKVYDRQGNDLYPEPGEEVLEHICAPNEKLWHLAVVHEQLALDRKIRVLYEDQDYIAVSKPSSIPVYHTGTYHYNTLVEILRREVLKGRVVDLLPVHRLDKLTSGVIIFAKNSKAAAEFGVGLRNNQFRKVYLARVTGDFSSVLDQHDCITVDGARVACCHGYMRVVSHKLSVHEFTLDGEQKVVKPAETHFRFMAYNPAIDESLIMCYPVTGRTHQIRAHLKFLGFPISNDVCYNDKKLSADRSYFPALPMVHWELDEQGRWSMPELGFVSPEAAKSSQGSKHYHVGLNKLTEGQKPSPTGIFLHAMRYIWLGRLDVLDAAPEWIREFHIKEDTLPTLKLWQADP